MIRAYSGKAAHILQSRFINCHHKISLTQLFEADSAVAGSSLLASIDFYNISQTFWTIPSFLDVMV